MSPTAYPTVPRGSALLNKNLLEADLQTNYKHFSTIPVAIDKQCNKALPEMEDYEGHRKKMADIINTPEIKLFLISQTANLCPRQYRTTDLYQFDCLYSISFLLRLC